MEVILWLLAQSSALSGSQVSVRCAGNFGLDVSVSLTLCITSSLHQHFKDVFGEIVCIEYKYNLTCVSSFVSCDLMLPFHLLMRKFSINLLKLASIMFVLDHVAS